MRASTKITFPILALIIAHAAFAQAPATHRSGKELYDEILQSEQRGRAMFDLTFKGIPVDDKKAVANFQEGLAAEDELEKLAKAGDTEARYYMGLDHIHNGEMELAAARQDPNNSTAANLADREYKKAAEWIKPLADQNIPQAQWVYGELYANGNGVNKSSSNAVEWWFKAAQTYLKTGDRENALTLFDKMRNVDQSNPRVSKLQKLLFPN